MLTYPTLSERYDKALREAAAYILGRFDVTGIIAAGSIIRGTPNNTSDFDIYAIHAHPQRQLIHRIFNGVATQIFLNPPHQIRRYFEDERAEGRPSTAHMLVTGFVMLDRDPVVQQLREEAEAVLQSGAVISPNALQMTRYHALDQYENAIDMWQSDVATGSMIMHGAVADMLNYVYLVKQAFVPRHKELLTRLDSDYPEIAALARTFFTTPDLNTRLEAAGKITDLTIQTRLFFEMETPLEDV
jgi:hypothetical protein